MSRKRLSLRIARRLETYFGEKRCVVSGTEHAEYHHLDEDDTNTTFVNLVPLGATFNSPVLRDAKKVSPNLLIRAELNPNTLLHTAHKHFSVWNVPAAYGCARLAYFIAKLYLAMDAES